MQNHRITIPLIYLLYATFAQSSTWDKRY